MPRGITPPYILTASSQVIRSVAINLRRTPCSSLSVGLYLATYLLEVAQVERATSFLHRFALDDSARDLL